MLIPTLKSELVRLGTYQTASFKVCAPLYSRLGFYFDVDQNCLVCYSCSLSLKSSELKPDCYALHKNRSPNCRFINGCDEANVGLKIEPWKNDTESNSFLSRNNSLTNVEHETTATDLKENESRSSHPDKENSKSVKLVQNSSILAVYQEAKARLALSEQKFPQSNSSPAAVKRPTTTTDLKENESKKKMTHLEKENYNSVPTTIENSSMWTVYQEARTRAEQKGISYDIPTNLAMVYHVEPAIPQTVGSDLPERSRETSASENETSVNNNVSASLRENVTTVPAASVLVDRMNPKESDYDLLRRESVRLSTYHDWPSSAKKRKGELAAHGFFYAGLSDRVQCAFCREHLRNWAADDIISVEHSRHFPNCSFVCQSGDNNIRDVPPASPSQSRGPSGMSFDGPNSSTHIAISGRSSIDAANNMDHISTSTTTSSTTAETNKQEKKTSTVQDEHGSRSLLSGSVAVGGAEGGHEVVPSASPSKQIRNEPKMNSFDDKNTLLEENKRLKDARTCKVCMDKEMNTIFLTCGHLICCEICAQGMKTCPICRNIIRATVKTMMF